VQQSASIPRMGNSSPSNPTAVVAKCGYLARCLLLAACSMAGAGVFSAPAPRDWNTPIPFDGWQDQSSAARSQRWQDIIVNGQGTEALEQLRAVNDFFNDARFVDDQELYGVPDYWATPDEFIARDAGDCEDFAIAKYFTLKAMGMDVAKLRITYVKAEVPNQAHMVLAYYATPDAEPLILDNLNRLIKPASERPDLRPVYSFNAEALWLSRTRNEQIRTGNPTQLEQWREMVARLGPQLR
jgi:predicted transglutaminase-like cysteine proteinase